MNEVNHVLDFCSRDEEPVQVKEQSLVQELFRSFN